MKFLFHALYPYPTCLAVVCFLLWECSADGIFYRSSCCKGQANFVPDVYKKTTDFIEAYGYVAESHSVVTEDGYIVTVHRIPRKQYDSSYNEVRQPFRPVILIQHGIAGRSDNWLLNGPTSFPFVLNDAGYDVWLSDSRGNYYSKRHIRLSPNDPKFWDFSFHEQAYYDLPAMTDYIINTTGQSKIFYVGHSRGSTMIYVLLSLRPEYNDKFHLILNFAPVVYLRNSRSPLLQTIFKASTLDIKNLSRNFRLLTLPGINDKSVGFRKGLCVNGSATQLLCLQFIFSFAGYDHELFNTTNFPVISTHFPDGGSAKELLHYIQIANTDIFRPYDYNPETNLKVYGQYEPPEYNIENITAPMWLIYGRNDFVVSREDLSHLKSKLRNNVNVHEVPYKKFNHIDFLWGTKAYSLLYRPTVELLNNYWKYT